MTGRPPSSSRPGGPRGSGRPSGARSPATGARTPGRTPSGPSSGSVPRAAVAVATPGSGVRTPLRGVGTVSSTSAEKFAARVRLRRRRRAAVAGGAVTLGLVVGWLLFGSTALAVQHVEVVGLHRVSPEAVRAAVQFEIGHSMALVEPQTAAERVVGVPLVRSARVVRSWPATLRVEVVEREPLAAVPVAGGRVALMDRDGVVVETVAHAPAGLPLLDVDVARAGAATLRAARQVSDDLAVRLRPSVRRISAVTPDAVTLVLSDGTTVTWGSAQDGSRKSAALLALHPRALPHPVAVDVSSPETPAITQPR